VLTSTNIAYHWSELWRSLLSFIRFLTTYVTDIKPLPQTPHLLTTLLNTIALSLSTGESFLPDTASYDDLFYKLVETGDTLIKFRDAYNLSTPTTGRGGGNSIETLISVSRHYHSLLEGDTGKGKAHLSMREVHRVIQGGYDTLSITAREGLERWEAFREVDQRNVLKRVAKVAVEDSKVLLGDL
jgi:hypothetical protein